MNFIREWVVVGGGRWAVINLRELVPILKDSMPERLVVVDEGLNSDESLGAVIKEIREIGCTVEVKKLIPSKLAGSTTSVALVLNSSYRHAKSINELLTKGFHVVTEKPISWSVSETKRLIDLARENAVSFFGANTIAFMGLQDLLPVPISELTISDVQVVWTDPIGEERYGLRKVFDSSTPIICDVLPHVANLLWIVGLHDNGISVRQMDILHGGSEVKLELTSAGSVPIRLRIARNAKSRRRFIRLGFVGSIYRSTEIDFSQHPFKGVSLIPPAEVALCRESKNLNRSLFRMFCAVRAAVEESRISDRLSIDRALFGDYLISLVLEEYISVQVNTFWRTNCVSSSFEDSISSAYALKELTSLRERVIPELNYPNCLQTYLS